MITERELFYMAKRAGTEDVEAVPKRRFTDEDEQEKKKFSARNTIDTAKNALMTAVGLGASAGKSVLSIAKVGPPQTMDPRYNGV